VAGNILVDILFPRPRLSPDVPPLVLTPARVVEVRRRPSNAALRVVEARQASRLKREEGRKKKPGLRWG
jgi:hypothetical protein